MKKLLGLLLLWGVFAHLLEAKDISEIRNSLSSIVNQAFMKQANENHVVALAAKNKMLSQKIAKDAVLLAYYPDKKIYYHNMLAAAKKFDAVLKGLYQGDAKLNIKKAEDPKVLAHLDQVSAAWQLMYKNIKNIYENGKFSRNAYHYIMANNEKILRLSHKLTQTLKNNIKIVTTLNKIVEHSLKIADRQRMLTQKMFKEKLLIFNDDDKDRNSIRLKGSIILFENGLNGLLEGEKRRGLVKITNQKIHQKLKEVASYWEKVEAIYRNSRVSQEDIDLLKNYEPKLLNSSEEVVTLIEESLEI